MVFYVCILVSGAVLAAVQTPGGETPDHRDTRRVVLQSPGGDLPFILQSQRTGDAVRAWIANGSERIAVDVASLDAGGIVLRFDHFDSRIQTRFDTKSGAYVGQWVKRTGPSQWSRLACRIEPVTHHPARFWPPIDTAKWGERSVAGRWSVRFSGSREPSVGMFRQTAGGRVEGTFLTTTGDYRFLAGDFDGTRLRLSCFDGAHAFLFIAKLDPHDQLSGDFWSRDNWHETWTARRDAHAALPDAMELTHWTGSVDLDAIRFPDLDGKPRRLSDPEFAGRARIIEIFGSWCPNCHDAARYLSELDDRYRGRGLSIVGLAFELTGDFDRDAAQVRRYAERFNITYPLLIAGISDKSAASRAFPLLDRIRAYPTTIFMDAEGNVRAVHTGFSGPATGPEHRALRARFENLIETMLSAPDQPHTP